MLMSALSREYVHVAVTAADVDNTPVDPSSSAVEIAIVTAGTSVADGDFDDATWDALGDDPYVAKVLVGPGGSPSVTTLTAGTTYDVYVRVTDSPEVPVLYAYSIEAH